ncbi:MAG: polymer-forming cytoskeletal protein [Patescibacteria group bacterium]|jgi:cytoskeletal protein CcmA (bactofilin family)
MFAKTNDNSGMNLKEVETIVGPSVKVKGDFHCGGNIIVEGEVEGNLMCGNVLQIKSGSRITADVSAKEAVIGGEVKGNIKVSGFLEITETAKILGDIEAGIVSIARGAVFNGNCSMAKERQNGKEGRKAEERHE